MKKCFLIGRYIQLVISLIAGLKQLNFVSEQQLMSVHMIKFLDKRKVKIYEATKKTKYILQDDQPYCNSDQNYLPSTSSVPDITDDDPDAQM